MKSKSLILLFVSLFVLFSCDDGIKFDNPLDERNRTSDSNDTEAETESDGDKTDTASTNDEESVLNDSDSGNSMQDDADSTDDSGDPVPDENDSDDDSDFAPDNDENTDIPTNPCDPNPCTGISNSTGVCTVSSSNYICGCKSDYTWTGSTCKKLGSLTLGNICTGQNKCYNDSYEITCPTSSTADFFGQDAWYASLGKCTPQSFTVQTISNQKVVVDNNTGLMWQQTIPTDEYEKWDGAVSYCNGLSYAGYDDWRLPTPLELLTIVDNSKYDPALDTTYFPNTPSGYFWSSSTLVNDTSLAWKVDFYNGHVAVGHYYDETWYYVRCVRRNEWSNSTFSTSTVNSDAIVTDTKMGLIWQKTYETTKDWQEALDYCEDLTYAGYSDWRLPNKNELASLVNYEKYDPASDFPDMPSQSFWSSSTGVVNAYLAWRVYFGSGSMDYLDKPDDTYYVRCVRNAE